MKYQLAIRNATRLTLRQQLAGQGQGVPEGIRTHLDKTIEAIALKPGEDICILVAGETTPEKGAWGKFNCFALDQKTELPPLPTEKGAASSDESQAKVTPRPSATYVK